MAMFPLHEGQLVMAGSPYSARASGAVEWEDDDSFGRVARCRQDRRDYLFLDNVPYGESGQLAISLWMRSTGQLRGEDFQYIYSHASTPSQPSSANSIQIFLPEERHEDFGVLRAGISDSNDPIDLFYLDSDGAFVTDTPEDEPVGPQLVDPIDGAWHMVTLSTLAAGSKGFRLFLDGRQVAEAAFGTVRQGVAAKGGDPFLASGMIFLCGRGDFEPDRFFDGWITRLRLYNTSLSADQVNELYLESLAGQLPSAEAPSAETPAAQRAADRDSGLGATQIAADAARQSDAFPRPMAFFPLQGGDVSASNSRYQGSAEGVTWEQDGRFGLVPRCSQVDRHIMLDNVAYGVSGSFSISFWMRASTQLEGSSFQYVFSHSSGTNYSFDPNSIQVYLPEEGTGAGGVLRAAVSDADDSSDSVFLDSDGLISSTGPKQRRANGDVDQPVQPADGEWHLVTLTTQPDGSAGWRLYLDDDRVASLRAGGTVPAKGGDPFTAEGRIHLCGRSDRSPARHFDGEVTRLALFNQALLPQQIRDLFNDPALVGPMPEAAQQDGDAQDTEPAPVRTTLRGSQCMLPFRLDGQVLFDCVDIAGDGRQQCISEDSQEWEVCAASNAPAAEAEADTLQQLAPAEGHLFTTSGMPCLWPILHQGHVYMNSCPLVSGVQSCRVAPGGAWQPCLQPRTSEDRAQAAAPGMEAVFSSTEPLKLRTLTDVGLEEGELCNRTQGDATCAGAMVCAAFDLAAVLLPAGPSQQVRQRPVVDSEQQRVIGVCARRPQGGVALPDDANFPLPAAYFPLTGGQLSSWPLPVYNGRHRGSRSSGYVSLQDSGFGVVLRCHERASDTLLLDNVPYGITGKLAVSVWFKTGNNSGDNLQYLLSHQPALRPDEMYSGVFQPNSLHLYMGEQGHAVWNMVRAILMDSNDFHGVTGNVWLDTDGRVSDMRPDRGDPNDSPTDGDWHMISLSTLEEEPGFALFFDGEQVAQISGSRPHEGVLIDSNAQAYTTAVLTTGGDAPFAPSGDIHLCARTDVDPDRHFDGSVAHLYLFAQSLAPDQVLELYNAGAELQRANRRMAPPAPGLEAPQQPAATLDAVLEIPERVVRGTGELCLLPIIIEDVLVADCLPINGAMRCLTAEDEGEWKRCEDKEGSPSTVAPDAPAVPTQRRTADGGACLLPFLHDGQLHYDCARIDGRSACLSAEDLQLRACEAPASAADSNASSSSSQAAPMAGALDTLPQASDGALCAVPYVYEGEMHYSCMLRSGQPTCPSSGGELHPCEPTPAVLAAAGVETYATRQPQAAGALPIRWAAPHPECSLPFVFQGDARYGCVNLNGGPWCLAANQTWLQCGSSNATLQEGAAAPAECAFPFQYNQQMYTTCVEIGGEPRCKSADGALILCNPPADAAAAAPAAEKPGAESCRFPFVYQGDVHQECVIIGGQLRCKDAEGELIICPARQAAPAATAAVLVPEDEEGGVGICGEDNPITLVVGGTAADGSRGLPPGEQCGLQAGGSQSSACDERLVCAPAPEALRLQEVLSGLPAAATSAQRSAAPRAPPPPHLLPAQGVCSGLPGSEAAARLLRSWTSCLPPPLAFFPLAGSLDSWPAAVFGAAGLGQEPAWQPDPDFDTVLSCRQRGRPSGAPEAVLLKNVPYGWRGPLAVSLWVQAASLSGGGEQMEFVFSHSAASPGEELSLLHANQVQILMHKAHTSQRTIVRALLKDFDDIPLQGMQEEVWLDSDGSIGGRTPGIPANMDPADGRWHMVTLSTLPDMLAAAKHPRGYALYLDGIMVAELSSHIRVHVKDANNSWPSLDGGDPAGMSGAISLCDSSSGSGQHRFQGNLSSLLLFEQALTPQQVADLHEAHFKGQRSFQAAAEGERLRGRQVTMSGHPCDNRFRYRGWEHQDCIPIGGVHRCPVGHLWEACGLLPEGPQRGSAPPILQPLDLVLMRTGLEQPRFTVSGLQCVQPTVYRGHIIRDCLPAGNTSMCQVDGGQWEECDLSGTEPGLDAPTLAQPSQTAAPAATPSPLLQDRLRVVMTTAGQPCQFPFTYDGQEHRECIPINGENKCMLASGQLAACSLNAAEELRVVGASARYTMSGEECIFPMEHEGSLFFDCVEVLGRESCRADPAAALEPCRPVPTDSVPASSNTTAAPRNTTSVMIAARETIDGIQCALPFLYEGQVRSDCVQLSGGEQCVTVNGSMGACASPSTQPQMYELAGAVRKTVQDEACRIPFLLQNLVMTDCADLGGLPYCPVEDGSWRACQPLTTMQLAGSTANVTSSSAPASDGASAQLVPETQQQLPQRDAVLLQRRQTASGESCNIPFLWDGTLRYDCADIQGEPRCPATPQQVLQSCSQAAAADPSSSGSGPLGRRLLQQEPQPAVPWRVQYRVTMDGDPCIIPFVDGGVVFSDCMPLAQGVEVCPSFSGSMQPCRPVQEQGNGSENGAHSLMVAQRTTVSGRACILPDLVRNQVITDCLPVGGVSHCRVASSTWEQCAPPGGSQPASAAEAQEAVAAAPLPATDSPEELPTQTVPSSAAPSVSTNGSGEDAAAVAELAGSGSGDGDGDSGTPSWVWPVVGVAGAALVLCAGAGLYLGLRQRRKRAGKGSFKELNESCSGVLPSHGHAPRGRDGFVRTHSGLSSNTSGTHSMWSLRHSDSAASGPRGGGKAVAKATELSSSPDRPAPTEEIPSPFEESQRRAVVRGEAPGVADAPIVAQSCGIGDDGLPSASVQANVAEPTPGSDARLGTRRGAVRRAKPVVPGMESASSAAGAQFEATISTTNSASESFLMQTASDTPML